MTEYTNEELVAIIQNTSDHSKRMDYLTTLFLQNHQYFMKICKRFAVHDDLDDLMQESFIAIITAVERYDPGQGVPFVNYAAIWIEAKIKKYIGNCNSVLRLPVNLRSVLLKYVKTEKSFEIENGRKPTDEEMMKLLSLTSKQLEKVKSKAILLDILSIDRSANSLNGHTTYAELILDPVDHYEEITEQIDEDIKKQVIWDEVDKLKDNEAEVVRSYFKDEKSLAMIGADRNCSSENIRQIRDRALRNLRRSRKILQYADEYLSAKAYTGTGLTSFRNTGTSAPERVAIEHVDQMRNHERAVNREARRIVILDCMNLQKQIAE